MAERVSLTGIDDANHQEAYERVLPEAKRLPSEQIRGVNLDIETVILRAMAAAKQILPFEARLLTLTDFPAERLDRFADYTLALYNAHLRYTYATSRTEVLPALSATANRWRSILLAELKSLVARELIQADQLDTLIGHQGFRNVARDLGGLAQIFKANWDHIKDETGLKPAKIEEVGQIALKVTNAIATRKRTPEEIKAARDIRERMFTLLARAYDTIRRAIQYIRAERHDADEIIPSLYSGRRKSKGMAQATEESFEQSPCLSASASTSSGSPVEEIAELPASEPPISGPRVPTGFPGSCPLDDSWSPPSPQHYRAATAESEPITADGRRRTGKEERSIRRRKPVPFGTFTAGAFSREPLNDLSALVRPSPKPNTERGVPREAPKVAN
ncbi:MAG: hypothetical protein QM784_08030 [Polyangiaceae bacterium]